MAEPPTPRSFSESKVVFHDYRETPGLTSNNEISMDDHGWVQEKIAIFTGEYKPFHGFSGNFPFTQLWDKLLDDNMWICIRHGVEYNVSLLGTGRQQLIIV